MSTTTTTPSHKTNEAKRLKQMLAEFDDNKTLDEIGETHGVTRERVRQIIVGHRDPRGRGWRKPITPQEYGEALRAALDGEWVYGRRHQFDEWMRSLDPSPALIPRSNQRMDRFDVERYRDEWVADIKRAAKKIKGPVSREAFAQWAKENDKRGPQLVTRTGLSWRELCHRAGVKTPEGKRGASFPRSDRVWTVDRCDDAMDEFVDWCINTNTSVSYSSYVKEARNHPGAWPSGPTLRNRIPGSSSILAEKMRMKLNRHYTKALSRLHDGKPVDFESYKGTLR